MKILLSAYACEPGQGSEEGVGWNMSLAIARDNEVWVLTRSFYREAIEAEIVARPQPNLNFIYFEPLGWSEDWRGKQGAVQFHYYLWQIQAYSVASSLHKSLCFDVAHHITYVKFWSPSFLALLPVPLIWGPVGGGEFTPRSFWKDFSFKAKIYETLRDYAQRLGEIDPFTKVTACRSRIAYATTEDTAKRLKQLKASNIKIFPESGLSQLEINSLSQYPIPPEQPVRFVSIGRLLHWKGFHLGIKAFLKADIPDAEYWVIGDGPERTVLESIVNSSGKPSNVKFFGKILRNSVLEKLTESHIVVHPSLHDSGGWTCLEAMAAGRPVICLALGGPKEQVTEETGIRVVANNPEQVIQDMALAMTKLAMSPEVRQKMGEAGRERIRKVFDWEAKGDYFSQIYREVVGQDGKQ